MAFDLGDIDQRSQMRVANILTCLVISSTK